jgi:hypothetical protein
MLAQVLAEAPRNSEVRDAAIASIGWPAVNALRMVIDRWIERGDIDASVPTDLIASLVPSVAFHRVALLHQGLDESTVVALVDDVLLPALRARRQ